MTHEEPRYEFQNGDIETGVVILGAAYGAAIIAMILWLMF